MLHNHNSRVMVGATFMQRVVVICLHGVNAVSLTCTDEDFGGGIARLQP